MIDQLLQEPIQIAPWILLSLGGFVGALSGLLGVGGGVLMTPALHILGLPMPLAVGTTLTQMVASSISGTIKHHSQANVSWPLVLAFGLPGVLGVLGGKELMVFVAHKPQLMAKLGLIYAGFLVLMAGLMAKRELAPKGSSGRRSIWKVGPRWSQGQGLYEIYYLPCIFFGVLIGVVSGLTGLGGGFFYMPIMSQLMDMPLKVSVGSSLGIVVISSIVGATSYGFAGMSDLNMAAMIAVGSIVGSVLGATATQFVQGRRLKLMFATLVLMAAISMVFKSYGHMNLSLGILFISGFSLVLVAMTTAIQNYLSMANK
ncbi:sulfite exporter TauE/SafE family protein [Pseudobacteriovorax antillogorgiicola]|uniref:Probable membrane transporter protein n=1 Tax=Pseudobacteriovorax antillogorgiicola TaxID=1513793 RepID=A0A1Y6BWR1_9BACT|nr:sulfite exporter TauE/SafE family protein [Pseudobacteriovorax antillogorgiicola]TCS50242.1 hypothetical protein EDD56_11360 [Pseudobacteriovorax antillogorgiicola]SMF32816.1 hypothetical protein SAMN06296036_11059 [Pseudobacteriovorax antillogorgiicola]